MLRAYPSQKRSLGEAAVCEKIRVAAICGDYCSQNAKNKAGMRSDELQGAGRMEQTPVLSQFEWILRLRHAKFAGLVHIGIKTC